MSVKKAITSTIVKIAVERQLSPSSPIYEPEPVAVEQSTEARMMHFKVCDSGGSLVLLRCDLKELDQKQQQQQRHQSGHNDLQAPIDEWLPDSANPLPPLFNLTATESTNAMELEETNAETESTEAHAVPVEEADEQQQDDYGDATDDTDEQFSRAEFADDALADWVTEDNLYRLFSKQKFDGPAWWRVFRPVDVGIRLAECLYCAFEDVDYAKLDHAAHDDCDNNNLSCSGEGDCRPDGDSDASARRRRRWLERRGSSALWRTPPSDVVKRLLNDAR